MPEGVEADATLTEAANVVFKDLNLTQEQAQKLVDFNAQNQLKQVEQSTKDFDTMKATWESEGRADPKMGGDKWDATVVDARKAVNAFGNDGFKQILNDTGTGNHPEVIRMLANIGKHLNEDGVIAGQVSAPKGDTASILYPTMK